MVLQAKWKYLKCIFLLSLFLVTLHTAGRGGGNEPAARAILVHHITNYFPGQLTNPQKKTRKTMAQFGYNLSYFTIPLFPITAFIDPNDFGVHSYSQPSRKENNGSLYTCRGGFIDFSHLRAAADWTVYLTFTILQDKGDLNLPPEAGKLKLHFKNIEELSTRDVVDMAQKIAFERLVWHEVASWHYHAPYHMRSDQQSSFTPEDSYSNFLGTEIGKKIALRILTELDTRPYEVIATEAIEQTIHALEPVAGKKESKLAYDIVDRYKQLQLPEDKRNKDVWWDSNILFRDQRYIFKRDIELGPAIDPWLVPVSAALGCAAEQSPEIFSVPAQTGAGVSFYEYYDFRISPDTTMFYGRKGTRVHRSFPSFTTQHFDVVVSIIAREMEAVFLPGFDKRDCCDPVHDYKNVRRVGLAEVMNGRHEPR